MSTLVAEAESPQAYNGVYYGLSLYETAEGRFQAVLHTRIYDGVRVQDKWDSGRIDLDAHNKDDAWKEALTQVKALQRAAWKDEPDGLPQLPDPRTPRAAHERRPHPVRRRARARRPRADLQPEGWEALMVDRYEWSEIKDAEVSLAEPGDVEGEDRPNAGPALVVMTGSNGAVMEAESWDALATWLEGLAADARDRAEFSPEEVARLGAKAVEANLECRRSGHEFPSVADEVKVRHVKEHGEYPETCARCGMRRTWSLVGGMWQITGYVYPEAWRP